MELLDELEQLEDELDLSQGKQHGRDLTLESLPTRADLASEQQLEELEEEQDTFKSRQGWRSNGWSATGIYLKLQDEALEQLLEDELEQLLEEELELEEELLDLFLHPLQRLRPQLLHIVSTEMKWGMSLILGNTYFDEKSKIVIHSVRSF